MMKALQKLGKSMKQTSKAFGRFNKAARPKPEVQPFFAFYITVPLLGLWDSIYRKFVGSWYCSHCGMTHGRRVVKYSCRDYIDFAKTQSSTMCSLGSVERPR